MRTLGMIFLLILFALLGAIGFGYVEYKLGVNLGGNNGGGNTGNPSAGSGATNPPVTPQTIAANLATGTYINPRWISFLPDAVNNILFGAQSSTSPFPME